MTIAGLAADSLAYDQQGNLMIKLRVFKGPNDGQVYVAELYAKNTFGHLADRLAR